MNHTTLNASQAPSFSLTREVIDWQDLGRAIQNALEGGLPPGDPLPPEYGAIVVLAMGPRPKAVTAVRLGEAEQEPMPLDSAALGWIRAMEDFDRF